MDFIIRDKTTGESLYDYRQSGAHLTDLDLSNADLNFVKEDFFDILGHATHEVSGLLQALNDGEIEGGCYRGVCACLVGTIANIRGCNFKLLPGIVPDMNRPAEIWFTHIEEGDTPENSQVCRITRDWILEWQTCEFNRRDRHQDMDAWARNESEG